MNPYALIARWFDRRRESQIEDLAPDTVRCPTFSLEADGVQRDSETRVLVSGVHEAARFIDETDVD
jgi:hypothetical protein